MLKANPNGVQYRNNLPYQFFHQLKEQVIYFISPYSE